MTSKTGKQILASKSKPKQPKPNSKKSNVKKPKPAKTNSKKPNPASKKPKITKPKPAKTNSKKPKITKPEPSKPNSKKPKTEKTNSKKPKTDKQESDAAGLKHANKILAESGNVRDLSEALSFLQNATKHFPQSTADVGVGFTKYDEWFTYLQKYSKLGGICSLDTLMLFMVVLNNSIIIPIQEYIPPMKPTSRDIVSKFEECEKSKPKIIILPMILLMVTDPNYKTNSNTEKWDLLQPSLSDGHANILIIDTSRKSIDWFEPRGFSNLESDTHEDFINSMYKTLKKFPFLSGYKFTKPDILCPILQTSKKDPAPKGGYCVVYCSLYAHMKILVPNATTKAITTALDKLPLKDMHILLRKYARWQELILA